ncbi:hypothetical protein ACIZ62_15695 [Acetobacterium carbinolicum]|uniref:hypothetical protein n=1 Tax=Acetobacterium carbinolicum TaxID=52690 RepID=UPI0039BFCB02
MRYLNQFNLFDMNSFMEGKVFMCTACREWKDFETNLHRGTVVDVVITQDNTVYKQKNGETVTNLYEKLSFKVAKDIAVPVKTNIMPVNSTATIFGQYRNQLSIKCDDIKVISNSDTPRNQVEEKSTLQK